MDLNTITQWAQDLLGGAKDRFVDVLEETPVVILRNKDGEELAFPREAIEWADARANGPPRRVGTSTHTELSSFVAYVERMKCDDSTIWADIATGRILAVLDYHPEGGDPKATAWGNHCARYVATLTPQWQAWIALNGATVWQDQLADFLEDHVEDLDGARKGKEYPSAAAMLELCRDLKVHTKGIFERKLDPRTGASVLVCKLDNEASSTPIPKAFVVAIPIYEGGPAYQLEVALRLKLVGNGAQFAITIRRAEEFKRQAFGEMRALVAEKCGRTVFAGTPE